MNYGFFNTSPYKDIVDALPFVRTYKGNCYRLISVYARLFILTLSFLPAQALLNTCKLIDFLGSEWAWLKTQVYIVPDLCIERLCLHYTHYWFQRIFPLYTLIPPCTTTKHVIGLMWSFFYEKFALAFDHLCVTIATKSCLELQLCS